MVRCAIDCSIRVVTVILEYLEKVEGTLPFFFQGWGLPPLIITNNYGVSVSLPTKETIEVVTEITLTCI